jgi:hypothetical protein
MLALRRVQWQIFEPLIALVVEDVRQPLHRKNNPASLSSDKDTAERAGGRRRISRLPRPLPDAANLPSAEPVDCAEAGDFFHAAV